MILSLCDSYIATQLYCRVATVILPSAVFVVLTASFRGRSILLFRKSEKKSSIKFRKSEGKTALYGKKSPFHGEMTGERSIFRTRKNAQKSAFRWYTRAEFGSIIKLTKSIQEVKI